MNHTAAHSLDASPARSIYERLVLSAFGQMRAGCLRLTLPDRETITIGTPGAEITACMEVRDTAFFKRCVLHGDIGFGESYVAGEWDTDSIERVIAWAIVNQDNVPGMSGSRRRSVALNLLKFTNRLAHLLRPNSIKTARRNIAEHYDLGNDFYRLWLDPTMTYSAARYTSPDQPLELAQHEKYDALCRHLHLGADDHVLEIGSGWGGFACHAARHFGCRVTTVTISHEQFAYARERIAREGLADRVEIRLQDYRQLEGQFDRIVSIEMMEALGERYLHTYCQRLAALLKPDGMIGVQYITVPDHRHAALRRNVDFIQKHIFPGSLLLSVARVGKKLQRAGGFSLHQLDDLGLDYARTLRAWFENFNAALPQVRALGFDDRFIRKWNYYLQYCEAAFATRNISVVQAIYTRANNPRLFLR